MAAKVTHRTTDPSQDKLDVLAVLVFENEKPSARPGLEGLLGNAAAVEKNGDFKGKAREQVLLYPQNGAKAERVLLAGLGKREKASLEAVRKAVGGIVTKAIAIKVKSVGIMLSGWQVESALDGAFVAAAAAEAAVLAGYKFERHKTSSAEGEESEDGVTRVAKKEAPDIAVSVYSSKKVRRAPAAVELAVLVSESANLARDIANEPANHGTPTRLAKAATDAGAQAGFKVTILERADAKKLGMGAFLSVAAGTEEPCKFIVMEYEPPEGTRGVAKRGAHVLVGKGITFDSGGISIKPADKMWEMKFDKSGGCAVIGIMHAVARAKLPLKVIGIVPATENLPSGTATKPGDVVAAMSGKTIEIQNTDAEGRLILADGLCYAARYEPVTVIDMATLTGACVVALGEVRAGVMGTDEQLLADLKACGDHTGERVWPLPLDDDYGEHIKSDAADIKNLGRAGHAGAISAGYFLKHFAPPKAKWAHLDIAGTAWVTDGGRGYVGKGATGFGVRLAFEYLKRKSGKGSPATKAQAKAK
ncbi:leucyl aminopeptidase [bacterium]|nr:leucyl aminopeptidase [bacterium]